MHDKTRLWPPHESLRPLIETHGGGTVEDVLKGPAGEPIDGARARRIAVRAQVDLLHRLGAHGWLKTRE